MAPHQTSRSSQSRPSCQFQQRGFLLIEGLIAILIFSLGVLGLIAMGSAAIAAQTDARFRVDAAALADEIANNINILATRSTAPVAGPDTILQASLNDFQHLPAGAAGPGGCAFGGAATMNAVMLGLLNQAVAGASPRSLPQTTLNTQQIQVDTTAAGFNRVSITICWQGPDDRAQRFHTLVTYIN